MRPLICKELMLYIDSPKQLALHLCLIDNHTQADNELKEAVIKEFVPEKNHIDKEFLFYTIWLIIRKLDNMVLGSFCFHGEPVNGRVEIGYGLYEENKGSGYMTEAIGQIVEWAKKRNDIQNIFAETEMQNISSQRVLQKNGFSEITKDENSILWELSV
jgi:RimJ/RimL family protein N-acetyltransferase